jgi:integrase
MDKKQVRFKLVRFAFETTENRIRTQYLITDNKIPILEANQWLQVKAMRKISTSKEYGKRLVVFFNYLADKDLEYESVTNQHVKKFINKILYGDLDDFRLLYCETEIVYDTARRYLTVITEFYKWLANNYETNIKFQTRQDTYRAKKSFLYGQIYSYDYQYILDASLSRQKGRREYIKWYTEEQKRSLCNGFRTLRDEIIFRITLEGFRIDEVLSMKLLDYDSVEQVIQPTRSKGKTETRFGLNNHLRTVALPTKLCELLNRYVQTERLVAENTSGSISEYIFINLQEDKMQGRPLSYNNYYKILKRCAKRSGLDPAKIRTHSGRSTKVMEYIEHQALYPEDGIEDTTIMYSFGWKSLDSISHYRDYNNQVVAKATMEKLHRKKERADD